MTRRLRPPPRIASSYRRIRLKLAGRRALGKLHGDMACAIGEMRVKDSDPIAEQANTIIHEYFHNELYELGLDDGLGKRREELVVRNLANATSRLFSGRTNPEMRRFLMAALRKA